MRVIAYISTIIVATALMLGGAVIVAFSTPRVAGVGPLGVALAVGALSIFIYGPVILGSLTAYWNVRRSEDATRYFRRYLTVILGLDVLGVAAIVLYAVITGAPAWIPAIFIAVAAVLMVAARLIGPWLLRRDEAHPHPKDEWRPVEHREIMRKIAKIAMTFVVTLIVGLVVFGLLYQNRPRRIRVRQSRLLVGPVRFDRVSVRGHPGVAFHQSAAAKRHRPRSRPDTPIRNESPSQQARRVKCP